MASTPFPPLTSKFRTGYWIRLFISFVFGLAIAAILIYLMLKKGPIDFRNGFFWMTLLATLGFISSVVYTIFRGPKKMTVFENKIVIKYFFTGRVETIGLLEIAGFSSQKIRNRRGVGLSDGYWQLEIKLVDAESIIIDADEYENYAALAARLYKMRQGLNN